MKSIYVVKGRGIPTGERLAKLIWRYAAISGCELWEAKNVLIWRAKHGLSLYVERVAQGPVGKAVVR